MMTAIADDAVPVFVVVWVALGLASFLFFQFNRNTALKRTVFPIFIIVIGIIFGGFVYFIMGRLHPQILYLAIPAIILISFLNIRTTRFCDSCGRTLFRQPIFFSDTVFSALRSQTQMTTAATPIYALQACGR